MKSITILLIVFSLAFVKALNAQKAEQAELDSLFSVWEDQAQPDSNRTKAYSDYIFKGFITSNPDSAFVLAEALHRYAQKHNYPASKARGYNLQGIVNFEQGNFQLALEYYEKSLAIYEELGARKRVVTILGNIADMYENKGDYLRAIKFYEMSLEIQEELGDRKSEAAYLNKIGWLYQNQSNYSRSLEYFEKSLAIFEEIEDKRGISHCVNSIGLIYMDLGNYPRSLEYFEKCLAMFEEIEDKEGISNSLNNIGIIHIYKGNNSLGLEYYEKSLAIREEIGDKLGVAGSLSNIGLIYLNQGNYQTALEYLEKGLVIIEEIGNKQAIVLSLFNIGNLHVNQGNYSLALTYCTRSLEIAEELEILIGQKDACQCLYRSYKAMGKGNEALVYLEKMNVVTESLNTDETTKKLEQMEFAKQLLQDSIAQAETDRLLLEAHHEEMRAEEKSRNIAFGIGGFLLLLAGGLYTRVRYIRRSKANLQVEKDRSENLLLNILPEEIAHELKIYGKAEARDFDFVSILFTDFKGFTQASATLSAQDLVAELNTCFEKFDGIMAKYGIEKIKTIGDAYMAAGGLPIPTDDSIKNTVLAALEMQSFIYKRKSENEAANKPAFEMRVGIHTGPVVAGIVGVKKFQYDIWGDTVNTASRMESAGEVGKVNISQSTYELLKDDADFAFESRGKIEAKGKGEMEMWFVELI